MSRPSASTTSTTSATTGPPFTAAFGPAGELLEVIDLPAAAPVFLRASTHEGLLEQIEAQHFDVHGHEAIRAMRFELPDQWRRGEERESAGTRPSNFALLDGRREGPVWRIDRMVNPAFKALQQSLGAAAAVPVQDPFAAPCALAGIADRPPATALEPGWLVNVADDEAEPYLADGFSLVSNGVRWTDNMLPTLRFGHPQRSRPAQLTLWPHEVWSRDGSAASYDVLVDGAFRATVVLQPGVPLEVGFTAQEMAADEVKSVALRPHDAKMAADAPTHDHRRLGCALLAFRFDWIG